MKPDKAKLTFVESRDCGADLELPEFNVLKVKTVSNGMANYLVIETKRWAMDEDNIDELAKLLKKMLKDCNE